MVNFLKENEDIEMKNIGNNDNNYFDSINNSVIKEKEKEEVNKNINDIKPNINIFYKFNNNEIQKEKNNLKNYKDYLR